MVPVICSQLQHNNELSLLPPFLALSCQGGHSPILSRPTRYELPFLKCRAPWSSEHRLRFSKCQGFVIQWRFLELCPAKRETHIVCFIHICYGLFVKCLLWAHGFVSRWNYGEGGCRSDTNQRKSVSGGATPTSYPCLPSVLLRCHPFP